MEISNVQFKIQSTSTPPYNVIIISIYCAFRVTNSTQLQQFTCEWWEIKTKKQNQEEEMIIIRSFSF